MLFVIEKLFFKQSLKKPKNLHEWVNIVIFAFRNGLLAQLVRALR